MIALPSSRVAMLSIHTCQIDAVMFCPNHTHLGGQKEDGPNKVFASLTMGDGIGGLCILPIIHFLGVVWPRPRVYSSGGIN